MEITKHMWEAALRRIDRLEKRVSELEQQAAVPEWEQRFNKTAGAAMDEMIEGNKRYWMECKAAEKAKAAR